MSAEKIQSIIDGANLEFQKGNLEAGEKLLNRYLALEPNNAAALDTAARLAMRKGNLDQAEKFAQRAIAVQSLVAYVATLAEVLKAKGQLKEAAEYFQKILAKVPNELRSLIGLGEIFEQSDYRQHAIEAYRTALNVDPANASVALRYFGLLPIQELPGGLAVIDRARPPSDASAKQRMGFLHQYILYKEWAERARRGLMPFHASTLEESFFHFARSEVDEYERLADEVLADNPEHSGAITAKSLCLFSRDRRNESAAFFKKTGQRKPDAIYENITFEPEFYRNLAAATETQLAEKIPPLVDVIGAQFDEDNIVYLSCNYDYYVSFARPMLLSLSAVGKNPQIHLHIMDGSDADWTSVKEFCVGLNARIAISAERPGMDKADKMQARCYYHAIRFLRLLHHLDTYKKTLWLMDVDALVHRDPRDLFSQMGAADVAFRARPARWEPWNQYNASVISVRPTQNGRRYLRMICAYISYFHQQGKVRWGIDQLAMYAVYCYLRDEGNPPTVFLLDDRAVDYEYYDDGFVWCNSGRGKFLQLEQMAKGKTTPADPRQAKYFNALLKYTALLKS